MTSVTLWFAVFLVLCVLTMVPVHIHLAATRGSGGGAKKTRQRSGATRACPQCGQPTSMDSTFCEKCGVPLMLWKLKLARSVQGGQDTQGAHPVPIIHQDRCIGCGSCVNACDRKVLDIVAGKSAVTRLEACTGKSVCAEVCPTGACELTGGGAARRLEVPQIDSHFETNQKGIYAIGELGGMGLIKNAVNEGQLVVEKLKAHHTPREGVLDLVIVGAGPAGLSAGLAAKAAAISAVVLEQGAFADTIRRFPNRKIVMAEPLRVPLYGALWISNAPKEALLGVWQTIVDSAKLQINENEQVLSIRRTDNGTFLTQTSKAQYESQKVILAIGKRGSPRRLDVKGGELPKVMYTLADAQDYRGAKILVVGGGDSAAEAAIALSRQEGNEVSLSYRKKAFSRLKQKNLDNLNQAIAEKKIRFLPASQVQEVDEKSVLIGFEDGRSLRLENDYVFAMLGGSSPKAFLESLDIAMVTKEVREDSEEKIPA